MQVSLKVEDWVPLTIDSWANRAFKPFMEANPNIKIVHEDIAQNYVETLLTRLSGSSDIDVIAVAGDTFGSFLRAGATLDLSSYLKTDAPAIQLDKFVQWTLDGYASKSYPAMGLPPGQWGVPLVMFVWEFWHNVDMLDAAGLSVPKRGWTWDDFLSMCQKLTNQQKKVYGYQNQNWLLPLWPWVWENGGDALTPDGTKLAIGQPASVEAFAFLQKLQLQDKVFPSIDTTTQQGGNISFDSGHTAMITRGNWNLDLSTGWKFKWDVSYPPKGKAEGTLGEEVGYILNKGGKQKDASWQYLRWVLSPDGQKTLAVRDIVPNADVMKTDGLKNAPQNVRDIVVPLSADAIVHPDPIWYRPKYTPNDLQDRLAVLWTGEQKAADLLPKLEKEFNDALSKPIS